MKTRLHISAISIPLALCSSLFVGCANLNDPYSQGGYGSYGGGGYNQPYGGYNSQPYYGGPGYYNGSQNYQQQQRDLDRERRELERERERLERDRDSYRAPPPPPPAPRPVQDSCPSGFSPSENKCSPQERRNGCRDIRLPSGLGCVSR